MSFAVNSSDYYNDFGVSLLLTSCDFAAHALGHSKSALHLKFL